MGEEEWLDGYENDATNMLWPSKSTDLNLFLRALSRLGT